MTIDNIFSPFIFRNRIENNDFLKRKIAPYIIKAKRKQKSLIPFTWHCDVFSTYLNVDKEKELFDKNFDNACLMRAYIENVNIFLNEISLFTPAFNIDMWYNAYSKNQYQEWHDHAGGKCDFSAIHFLKYDDNIHSPPIFRNPTGKSRLFSSQKNKERLKDKNNIVNSVYNQIYTPTNIKEGDLIIFPSWLEHVVPQNKSNELRITVSFNIDLL